MSIKWSKGDRKCDYHHLVPFIPASHTPESVQSEVVQTIHSRCESGDDIKSYYESVVNDTSCKRSEPCESCSSFKHNDENSITSNVSSKCSVTKSNKKITVKRLCQSVQSQRFQFEMLKFAQNGDLISFKERIENGGNINYQDSFGWTALMCASVEGHVNVVEYLLSLGVDSLLENKLNQTARILAEQAKKHKIVKIIDNWSPVAIEKDEIDVKYKRFYCDLCKGDYTDISKHKSSTTHLFNRQIKPQDPHFSIPESNRGFQLMLKHGWDKSQGLGSKGQGQKYPVKTILKRDRHGLGSQFKLKSKITHFGAQDSGSVDRTNKKVERFVSARTLSRREMRWKEKREKNWEREMRQYFNTD